MKSFGQASPDHRRAAATLREGIITLGQTEKKG